MITTAHRRQRPAHPPTRPATLVGALIAAAAALLLAGCSPVTVSDAPASGTTSSPINTGSAGADATAEDGEDANADGSDGSDGSGEGCQVTVNGPGSIRVSGASNRVVTRNGASSLSCANGPMMAIEGVESGAVSFSIDGGQPVRIATGQTASVGDYSVTVNEADGERAEFVVA